MGGLIALLSALGFSLYSVLTRRGLAEENPGNEWEVRFVVLLATVFFFLIAIGIATFFGFNIITEFKSLTSTAVLLLILDGVLGPLIGGLFTVTAIAQIGSSHTSALAGGSNPFFATLFAILFLSERPSLLGIIAVLMIVGGIIIVGYRGYEGTVNLLAKTKIAGGLFALLAGLSYALSQIARGAAIKQGATPNTGFIVGLIIALIILTISCRIKSGNFKFIKHINRKSLYFYSSAGICSIVGRYAMLIAFTLIPVWQAVAIRNTQPILVIFLSWTILKKVENINIRLVAGAVSVTMGIVILNLYR